MVMVPDAEEQIRWDQPAKRSPRSQQPVRKRTVAQAQLDWISEAPGAYYDEWHRVHIELTMNPYEYTNRDLREWANRLLPKIEELELVATFDAAEDRWEDGEAWWTAREKLARLEAKWEVLAAELTRRKRVGFTCEPGSASITSNGRTDSYNPTADPFLNE